MFPPFDRQVPDDGYSWWYVDALSDDGRFGLTVIAFVGSVFSPWYARARKQGPADPEKFCALNVALYGRRKRWSFTERDQAAIERTPGDFRIGPSSVHWSGEHLVVDIDEVTVPFPSRLRGRVTVHPSALTGFTAKLDAEGLHRWSPIAPHGRVEVALNSPDLKWQGSAYLDSNHGDEPLERAFSSWDWSRAHLPDGSAAILYDTRLKRAPAPSLAIQVDTRGAITDFEPPPSTRVATAPIWRMPRQTRCEPGGQASVVKTFEDAPFYSRSNLRSQLLGHPVDMVHESLSLDDFVKPWVQLLLPFRAPRRSG